MWRVSSRRGVATLRTAIHLLLTYLLDWLISLSTAHGGPHCLCSNHRPRLMAQQRSRLAGQKRLAGVDRLDLVTHGRTADGTEYLLGLGQQVATLLQASLPVICMTVAGLHRQPLTGI